MKKNIFNFVILVFCVIISTAQARSRSFFRPRDISTDSTLELSQTNYHRYHSNSSNDDRWYTIFAKPFYMRSHRSSKLARYFFPCNKQCITLDQSGAGDVNPQWLNLIGPAGTFYSSTVTIKPKRSVGGILFTAYVNFCDEWWIGINTAAAEVVTNNHIFETNRTHIGVTEFENAYQAFNNPAWTAGKITACDQKKGGLDDIQLKLGYDFYRTAEDHATFYLVGTIPTGNRPKSCFLFEPLVGSRQASFGAGFNGDFIVREGNNSTLNIMTDLKYRYIFSGRERRSFDLCANGDWSRYLLVVTQAQPTISLPAINLLTLPVHVTQRNTIDYWFATHYQRCDFSFEFGYELWWRQAEKVCKKCPLAPGFGIQSLTAPTTASTANITQAAQGPNATVSDAQFTTITNSDLNLNSAAHPNAVANKLYAAFGYTHEKNNHAWLFGGGGSYEFGCKDALWQFALWLTAGLTF